MLFSLANAFEDYYSIDEPNCVEKCDNSDLECQKKLLNFYSYKLVKSIYNYGKTAIYAGLWNKRYEKAEKDLFETVLNDTIGAYKTTDYLGSFDPNEFSSLVYNFYSNFKSEVSDSQVKYGEYPILTCPTLCTYDLITWQTLFGISLAIFILALITISIYSIYLYKQYKALKDRLKSIKYTKVIS